MYEKISKWFSLLERFIDLIRPKAYNTIAKLVVITGIGLVVESQVNFIHALAVALFEQYLGKSELLREVLIATDNPALGIFLVIIGMTYHLVVTLGKDFIQNQKSKLPKFPELIVSLSTVEKRKQYTQVLLDSPDLSIPKSEEIPDFKREKDIDSQKDKLNSLFHSPFQGIGSKVEIYTNKNLYRQRANIIKEWSGFEPLELHLSNQGKILANGVRIQVVLPKNNESLSIFMPNDKLPSRPEKIFTNQARMIASDFDRDFLNYEDKMRITENDAHYVINWDVNTLQAGVIATGNKKIFIKVKHSVEIKYTVFCDELPEPKSSTLTLIPSEESVKINIDEITDDDKFEMLYGHHLPHAT